MTNFDEIRTQAMKIIEMEGCPDVVKDVFVKMVADDASLVNVQKALTILKINCEAYAHFVSSTTDLVITSVVLHILNKEGDKE